MKMISKPNFFSLRPKLTHAMLLASLVSSNSLLADVIIDPFGEGNNAVTGYFGDESNPSIYDLIVGAERLEDSESDPGDPGFGDLLINGGSIEELDPINFSYIGWGEGSRGRVYVEGPGTQLLAVGGLSVGGEGSVLSISNGGQVHGVYGIYVEDADAQIIVSGSGSRLSDTGGEDFDGGRLIVKADGGGKLLVSDGGQVFIDGEYFDASYGGHFRDALSLVETHTDVEVSGAGSKLESKHRIALHSAPGRSARVLDGGRIVQSEDFSDFENPVAFTFDGGDSYESGLIVSGFGSRIDLINDAVLGDSGFVTLSDGGSLNTEGSVLIKGSAPGATQVLMDDGRLKAESGLEIADGATLTARNDSHILGDVEVGYGVLRAEEAGLTIEGDLNVNGTLELEVGEQPALAVAGTTLFGPDSYLRLLLSAVPSGEILVDDYLLADIIDFDPQFSLAAQLDVQFDDDVDLSRGAEFTIAFAGSNHSTTYRHTGAVAVPEIDGASLPLALGLFCAILGLRREYRTQGAS